MTAHALVLDASAAIEVLRGSPTGGRVGTTLRGQVLATPAHFDAEVLMGIARMARRDELSEAHVERALRHLATLPIRRFALQPLLSGAWALRANIAMGDAIYVELARRLDAPLVTHDGRLARGAVDSGVDVRLISA